MIALLHSPPPPPLIFYTNSHWGDFCDRQCQSRAALDRSALSFEEKKRKKTFATCFQMRAASRR